MKFVALVRFEPQPNPMACLAIMETLALMATLLVQMVPSVKSETLATMVMELLKLVEKFLR